MSIGFLSFNYTSFLYSFNPRFHWSISTWTIHDCERFFRDSAWLARSGVLAPHRSTRFSAAHGLAGRALALLCSFPHNKRFTVHSQRTNARMPVRAPRHGHSRLAKRPHAGYVQAMIATQNAPNATQSNIKRHARRISMVDAEGVARLVAKGHSEAHAVAIINKFTYSAWMNWKSRGKRTGITSRFTP
jgi:hypothetical protein